MTCIGYYSSARLWFSVPGAPIANDGMPQWPGPVSSAGGISNAPSKLRSGGFGSFTVTTAGGHVWSAAATGAIGPLIAGAVPALDPLWPLTVTIDGGASDGGSDLYAWWYSMQIEPARAPSIACPNGLQIGNTPHRFTWGHPDRTHSGTVVITPVPSEVTKLFPGSGGVSPTDAASLATLCMYCHLYVSRRSDQSYAWARMIPE